MEPIDWPTARPLHEVKADLFKALAHPVRVRVLELLADHPRQVADLLTIIDVEPSTLSTHLAVLRRAGVVQGRREGTAVHYRLADPSVEQFLAAARAFLAHTLGQHTDILAELNETAAG